MANFFRTIFALCVIFTAAQQARAQGFDPLTGQPRAALDFNGDNRSDVVLVRGSSTGGLLFLFGSPPGGATPRDKIELGVLGDTVVPGNYDGDAFSDLAVAHGTPSGDLEWAIIESSQQTGLRTELHVIYGLKTDLPLPADYDGDGKTDLCVVRADAAGFLTWYPAASGGTPLPPVFWGLRGDYLLTADVDGDHKSDFAVVRVIDGELVWFIRTSAGPVVQGKRFGLAGDVPMLADFDGDGIAEMAVSRDLNGAKITIYESGELLNFGLAGDQPIFGNFQTNTHASFAVWRVLNGQGFFFFEGSFAGHAFGIAGDRIVQPFLPTTSTGSLYATSSAPQLRCAQRGPVTRQEVGFQWKPMSAADGKLAVLFGPSLKGKIVRSALVISAPQGDQVLGTLRFVGNNGGTRPTFRGNFPGALYPPGVILVRQDAAGNNTCIDVPQPARAVP